MYAILWAVVSWLLREVIIKFVIFTAMVCLISFLVPYAVEYVKPFLVGQALTSAFDNLPSGIWYFLDYFRVDFGLPVLISAYIARFMIRRLPIIG
jgi:hypothetical protein